MTSLFQNDKLIHEDSASTKYKSSDTNPLAINMPLNDYIEKQYDNVIKSENDNRLYRGLLLANKMKVLLISDPKTDKSAASLDVNIGFMSDPDELPGLAHFCEHMLFLGTEKYPKENEYNMYVSQNGGSCNASTYMDHTNYYFDINPEKLEGALDRFAQFFLAPLFTEELTELELNAINSEHEKNYAVDAWRLDQLDKSSADPAHPFSKFGTGNKETLDIIPKEKGINVREQLFEFHKKYYSANMMSLCVLGKESLDELEKMVVNLFSGVKNKDVDVPTWPEHPFSKKHFKNKWYIVPIKDLRNLNITFPLPDLHDYYQSAPAHYISYLLGHEGEGSLLSVLKAKGWCNKLVSGTRATARGFCFFNLLVDLTEEGINHVDDILLLVFQYINMLKKHGPIEWIYAEYRDIANVNFRFREKVTPSSYVYNTVKKLQDYPIEEVLTIGHTFPLWKPELVNWVLEYLTPENVRIHVIGKQFENIADESEKWYNTKFKREEISQEVIEKWNNAGYNSDLKLPTKNEFIPTKFDIKPAENNVSKFPEIVMDTSLIRLWFKQDNEFLVPKARVIINFVSPLTYIDPINCTLSNMFVELFRDALNEFAYTADLAGLKWDINNTKCGIVLVITGYDDKQRVLLDKILDRMIGFEVDPKRFNVLKEKYLRTLKNFDAEQPCEHAVYYLSVLLSEQAWMKHELLDACSQLTVERVQQFIPQFLSKLHVESLVYGNVTMAEAIDMVKLVETKLTTKVPHIITLLPRQLILYRDVRLEDGGQFLFEVENKLHRSSCTEVYFQSGLQSTESNMHIELLVQLITEPCFNILRTKEQLGYIVYAGVRKNISTQGLCVIVQSNRSPEYVEERINAFLESMLHHISNMSDEEFGRHIESLATKILEKPKKISTQCAVYWDEIVTQRYNFDRANIEVAHLRTLTREQILNFYKEIIYSDTRHKLSVHVISTVEDGPVEKENVIDIDKGKVSESIDKKEYKKIDDILSFKLSQSLYPLLKPYNDVPRKGAHSSKL